MNGINSQAKAGLLKGKLFPLSLALQKIAGIGNLHSHMGEGSL